MIREPAVAGSFYPAQPDVLRDLVSRLLDRASAMAPVDAPGRVDGASHLGPQGILVPHAGLEWSGVVAAAGWRWLAAAAPNRSPVSVVLLGTNHSARLDGVGLWPEGGWRTPLGEVAVDGEVAAAIADLGPPYHHHPGAHLREHSIEVQLPLLQVVELGAMIVPLAVSAGTGTDAIDAGARLGRLLATLNLPDRRIALAISTDLAHYPAHDEARRVTEALLPPILSTDPVTVAALERRLVEEEIPDLACGMCGIAPTVLGLAALHAAGVTPGVELARATSADAGAPRDRTVGYLAVGYPAPAA